MRSGGAAERLVGHQTGSARSSHRHTRENGRELIRRSTHPVMGIFFASNAPPMFVHAVTLNREANADCQRGG